MRVGNLRVEATGRVLEMCDIGAKSDYFEDGAVLEDPRSLQLHRRITRPLKGTLRRPMQAWHVAHTDRARSYDIYYSDRAAAFFHEGGELMQQGVANIRFSPQKDALPPV